MDALQNRSIVAEELKVRTCLDSNSSASYLQSIHGLKKLSLTLPSYSRSVDKIANNFFPDMPNPVVFQLTVQAPLTLESNAFRGLSGVQNATVTSTWDIVVKPRAFESLSALQNLAIITDDEQTIHLPEQPFEGLLSIETLKLQTGGCRQAPVVSNVTFRDIAHTIRNISLTGVNVTGRAFAGCANLRSVQWARGYRCYGEAKVGISPRAFQGASSLESVTLHSIRLQNIGGGMFEGLHNVVNLSIQFDTDDVRSYSPEIKYLPSDMFTGLSSVRRISLDGIPELPGDIFQGLATLREIRIENMVARATENSSGKFCYTDFQRLFTGLSSLEIVRLDDSEVRCETLPVSTFSSLPSLKELQNNMFKDLSSLKTLKMTGWLSQLRLPLPPKIFAGLRSLPVLDLQDLDDLLSVYTKNTLNLPRNLFEDLDRLEYLNLANAALKSLDKDTFKGLTNLRKLHLNGTSLTQQGLSTLPFANLKRLETLSLTNLPLDDLDPNLFVGAVSLSKIDLSDCRFTTIRSGTFSHLKNLTSLKMQQPRTIEKGAFDFENQRGVRIDLLFPFDFSPFPFPDDFAKLFSNRTLMENSSIQINFNVVPYFDCDCRMASLSVSYWRDPTLTGRIMPKAVCLFVLSRQGSPSWCLTTVVVGYDITEIDRTTCALNNANEVAVVVNNVSNNVLRCPVSPPSCPERCYCRTSTIVAEVFCTGRGLTAVPDRYPADTALARLDVNSIQYVPPVAFGNAPNLLVLNLSTNAIREVNGSAFLGLRRLAVLYLDGNDLSHVPADLLKPLASLRVLWLSDNNLLDLPGTIFHQLQQPTFLRVLRLDHNNLTTLSAGIFTNRTSLTKLSLDNNKFDCDCHLLWLKAWMLQRRSVVDQIESVTCRSRGNAEDKYVLKPIIELPDDAFVCGDDENAPYNPLVAWVAAPGGLAILLILVAGAFKCRKNVRVWVYARYRRGLRHLEQEPEKTYDFYVSYCVEDEEFVDREVVTVLEDMDPPYKVWYNMEDIDMDPPYKVCLRNRDFIPGQNNIQQATDSITNSRRTLLVLTERFLQDRWCLWEFQVAHQHAVTDQAYRLIIIIMDDLQLEACDDIPDLKQYLTANRYLLWGELLFWDKLQQAVPPAGARGVEGGREEGQEHHDDDDSDDEEHLDIFVPR
ncbi:Carboxypeptidase N [Branchiostoma belcheri]|nr:Carboxypeptidase N [Branchiostoma belcheri]